MIKNQLKKKLGKVEVVKKKEHWANVWTAVTKY